MPLAQLEQQHVGAAEAARCEEDTMVDEEAKEDVDPQTTPRKERSRSLSLSRSLSPRESRPRARSRASTAATPTELG
jgi:hypothetical protein